MEQYKDTDTDTDTTTVTDTDWIGKGGGPVISDEVPHNNTRIMIAVTTIASYFRPAI